MKENRTANWPRITFIAAIGIFFLSSVAVFDYNAIFLTRLLGIQPLISDIEPILPVADVYRLSQIMHVAQYLDVTVFLVSFILLIRQQRNWQTTTISTILGFATLTTVMILSVAKEYIDFELPITAGGLETPLLERLTTYISALSGLIAAITGLYSQIIAGRKSLAEVEVEKLRLQVEKEKAKTGKKKPAKSRK
jgi:hypothetical protein